MPKSSCRFFNLMLVVTLAAAGCVTPRCQVVHAPVRLSDQRGIVFALDGAGNYLAASSAFSEAVADDGLPLAVEVVEWSHGYGLFLADQMDHDHAVAEGKRLACRIADLRRTQPNMEIYIVSHSAGCAVALAAAESLPPGSLDRMVLLSPSVSADYDLRPSLRTTCQGIDVFYSKRDIGFLGVGTALVGTADRHWFSSAAGRVGFHPVLETPEDSILYSKLHQHGWDPCVEWSGHHGGHYGAYQPEHLRAYVLPLLSRQALASSR